MPLSSNKTAIRFAAAAVLCLPAMACTQPNYLNTGDRIDSVTFQAGDAVAHNKVVQTQNPWPGYARRTHIHTNGEKIDLAIDRYKSDQVKAPESEATGSVGGGS